MPATMWLLLSCLLAAAAPSLGRDCEKMKVPFCSKMPYEELRLPNLFGHETQEEVNRALEPLQELQTSGCFGHYSFMLCSALAPPCIADVEKPAPCRRVCERARDRCYGLMLMYNVTESWPDCDLLPKHSADPLCLTPTSLTPRDNCHCLKKHQPEKPTLELMNDRDYDYSIKARMDGFAPSHFPSILSVTVLDVFRDGIVEMKISNSSYIITDTSCKCPELEPGKEYLIMGKEDFNKTELLLTKDSYVVPWSDPIQKEYGNPAKEVYQDPDRRTYSRGYNRYSSYHGFSPGFSRPSFTTTMLAGGGAYLLYRHYKNKKKLGKVYGHPGYGGHGSAFGALGGGGYGALGNPRGKFTNYNNFAPPGGGAAFGGTPNYGYNNYNNYNNFNRAGQSGNQVPSYPITHKPNFATNKPSFNNRNLNPSYPVTNRPSYPATSKPYRASVTSKPYRTSSGRSYRAPTRRTSTSSRGWGRSSGRRGTSSSSSWDTQSIPRRTTRPPQQVWNPPPTTQRPSYPATRRPSYPATSRPSYPATRRPSYPATRRPSYTATRRPSSTRRTSSSRSRSGGSRGGRGRG